MQTFNLTEILSKSTKITTLQETKDYGLFGFIKGNRMINESNIKKIMQSIKRKAIKEIAIVVGFNGDPKKGKALYIIDGQHRFWAYYRLGLPIPFVVREDFDIDDPKKSLEDVERVNTASETWDVTDFMFSKCELGDINYINYKDIHHKYELEHEIIYFILNKKSDRIKINHESFKQGLLTLNNEEKFWLESNLNILKLFKEKFINESGKRYWFKAIIELIFTENIDLKRLNEQINNSDWKVPPTNTIKHSLEVIRDLYNDKLRKNKLFVGADGKKYDIYIK